VLKAPAPDVLLAHFDSSAINYRVWFWIDDYERDDLVRAEVRTAIYYAFARHGIDIPWPIQVQYERPWPEESAERLRDPTPLPGLALLAAPGDERRREIAEATAMRPYGNGEAIVRQGEPGQSMYVIGSGTAVIVIDPDHREVARIGRGGYFGEMSLLTGEPR